MLFLSIDPGGTKCEVCLCDENAQILGYCNITGEDIRDVNEFDNLKSRGGIGRTKEIIIKAINIVTKNIDLSNDIHIISTGVPVSIYQSVEYLNLNKDNVIIASEPAYAFYGEGIEEGFMALAGTGALCYYYSLGKYKSLDGLGPNLGDYGGGCYIGHRAIKAAAKSEWAPDKFTTLSKRINEILINKDTNSFGKDLINPFFNLPDRSFIASFSKIVNEEAEKGDRIAINILTEAGKALADTLRCVVYLAKPEKYNLPIICTGSIICKSRIYFDAFSKETNKNLPGCEIRKISIPPCYGGIVYLANKICNIPISEFQPKIIENAKNYHIKK